MTSAIATDAESVRGRTTGDGNERRASSRSALPLLVASAVLLPFIGLPLAFIFYGAVQPPEGFGRFSLNFDFSTIIRVYTSEPFLRSLIGTLLMSMAIAAFSVIFGTIYSWILCRTDVPMRRVLDGMMIAPLFLSPFVGAFSWLLLASPRSGMLNNIVQTFIADVTLFDVSGLKGTIFVLTLYYIPYAYLFMRPALMKMDASLEEASYVAGATAFSTALRIVFPMLMPALAASFLFITVLSTEVFSVPAVLGTGDWFIPLAVRVQRAVEVEPTNYAQAAAVGTMLLFVSGFGLYLYRKATRNAGRFVTVTGKAPRPRVLALGAWRWAALAICVLYGLLAVVLPNIGLVITSLSPFAITDVTQLRLSWTSFEQVLTSLTVRRAIFNTFLMSTIVATCCMLAGVVLAYLIHRSKIRGAQFIDYLATLPIAVPGIVFGVGMVWLLVWTPLYNTLAIMIIAFIVLYLPFCLRLASNALIQIDPSLEEASYVNGSSRSRTVALVSIPLAKAALLSGWIMAFIFSARELSAAVILYGPRTRVLSVLTWDYVSFGNMQSAAVVGVLQTLFLIAAVLIARVLFRVRLSESNV